MASSDGARVLLRNGSGESVKSEEFDLDQLLGAIVTDRTTGVKYILSATSIFQQRLQSAATEEDGKINKKLVFGVWTVLMLALSYFWMASAQRVHCDIEEGEGILHKFLNWVFSGFVILSLAWLCHTLWAVSHGGRVSELLSLCLLTYSCFQFTLYMSIIAWSYPNACKFTYWQSGKSFDYRQMGNATLMSELGSIVMLSEDDQVAKEWTVDCDAIKICPFISASELFALMAHSFPLITTAFVHWVGGTVKFTPELVDLVDLQDFWLLLLEDDIIKNFWGRDRCGEGGCTGNGRATWWAISITLFLSSLCIIARVIIKFHDVYFGVSQIDELLKPLGPESQGEQTPAQQIQHKSQLLRAAKGYFTTARATVMWTRGSTLGLLNLPYFIIRLACSQRYGIIGSTLLIKNFTYIMVDAVLLCYQGGLKSMSKKYPFLHKAAIAMEIEGAAEDDAIVLECLTPTGDDARSLSFGV